MGIAGLAPRAGYNVIAIDLPDARRLALSVVLGQAAVTLICALAAWLMFDSRAALSAALGGGISAAASLAMALLGFGGRSATDPERAVRAFFVGEIAKIAVMIVLFVAVLKTMKVVPLAMLGTYVATFFVFWVALADALPPLGGGARRRQDKGRVG
jgi:ATP synthase protein I